MQVQNYEMRDAEIDKAFDELKSTRPEQLEQRINFSWSNWGFGQEDLRTTARRLSENGIKYIELHGNHYGGDLGYEPGATKKVLGDFGIATAGVCGMFSVDNDLASNRGVKRQAAIDYIKREIEFTKEMGGSYILVVPGAVGRPNAYDDAEWERSIESLLLVADLFVKAGIEAAIEPIRSAEVSLVHTIADAKEYITAVNHPGIKHINADLYHMFTEEDHIPTALLDAGEMLANLHVADSNRRALGMGFLDVDRVIKALYLIGFNRNGRYFTPEPLGPGGDPYPAMHGKHDPKVLDEMVRQTVTYFREREQIVCGRS
jgi:D-psicose/D-tagatose/L-ribulose 3-epimerase